MPTTLGLWRPRRMGSSADSCASACLVPFRSVASHAFCPTFASGLFRARLLWSERLHRNGTGCVMVSDGVVELDIRANRKARKYNRGELARRILWSFARVLFRISPRPFFAWRRFVLRCFGADIAEGVHVYGSTEIY